MGPPLTFEIIYAAVDPQGRRAPHFISRQFRIEIKRADKDAPIRLVARENQKICAFRVLRFMQNNFDLQIAAAPV